ncbi:zf-C2H2 domain-containing protein [Cephalotus follicularis]|uniref:Zf-C2H2 domain-containing protein n=1 Tax=Cephalotus follicularis TaxID=3775 RepID=A0A1Q3B2L0_CEPFO|nr:zf-C2H2 domain-containing protein [Cephalotus follicularis]
MAAASSSSPFFGAREENQSQMIQHHTSATTSSTAPTTAPQKKKRNQPGTPNPDAEVIALSPKTLMATNRFICEVCNKGFQREQNLQLHRRGHNLPWKLKQKTTKEVKRKVYLCPEPTCVHHDPSRALGDLTGIKKHYSRKHGEKKWKCEKCSKRYAVQSDWKAHSKTCGTREYRCDCGTLFSRRDNFITHRAFCDALAEDSGRHPTSLSTVGSQLCGNNNMSICLSKGDSLVSPLQYQNHPSCNMFRLGSSTGGPKLEHLSSLQSIPSSFFMEDSNQRFQEQSHHGPSPNTSLHGLMQLPDLQSGSNNSPSSANLFNLSFYSNNSTTSSITISDNANNNNLPNSGFLSSSQFNNAMFSCDMGDNVGSSHNSLYNNSVQHETNSPHMSATALLQKAAQMGSTRSSNSSALLRDLASSGAKSDQPLVSSTFGSNFGSGSQIVSDNNFQGLINSLANGGGSSIFGNGTGNDNTLGGFSDSGITFYQQQNDGNYVKETKLHQNLGASIGGSGKLTLDFLGVGGMVKNMGGGFSHREQQHGINISSLDSEFKSAQASQHPFEKSKLH